MSDDNDNKKKTKRAININRVRLIGRAHKAPEKKKDGKYIRVHMLIPGYRKDNKMQWLPVSLDIFGDDRSRASEITHGDYVHATAFLVPKKVNDDNGDVKKLIMLQHNAYEGLGIVSGEMEGMDPPDDGLCLNEVVIAGRFIQRKSEREAGNMNPVVRGDDRKMCFLNVVYNDPRKKDDEEDSAIWLDVGLFGPQAEIAGQYTRHNDQVFVLGELSKREAGFTVGGRAPAEIKISSKPYGFQFCSLGSGGQRQEPKGADPEAYGDGELEDDDLPF